VGQGILSYLAYTLNSFFFNSSCWFGRLNDIPLCKSIEEEDWTWQDHVNAFRLAI